MPDQKNLRGALETFEAVLKCVADPLLVMDADGRIVVDNAAARALLAGRADAAASDSALDLRLARSERDPPLDPLDSPFARARRGEDVDAEELWTVLPDGRTSWLTITVRAIRDATGATTGTVAVLRDVTATKSSEQAVEAFNRGLVESEAAKDDAMRQLRLALDDLSIPVIEIWEDVLAMPLIGVVDSRRAAEMSDRLLSEVARRGAQCVILDVTGVAMLDTGTADHLIKAVRSVELLGAHCVVTGIAPRVATTLTTIGIELDAIDSYATLKQGLRACLRWMEQGRRTR